MLFSCPEKACYWVEENRSARRRAAGNGVDGKAIKKGEWRNRKRVGRLDARDDEVAEGFCSGKNYKKIGMTLWGEGHV